MNTTPKMILRTTMQKSPSREPTTEPPEEDIETLERDKQDKDNRELKCHLCPGIFSCARSLTIHVKKTHSKKKQENTEIQCGKVSLDKWTNLDKPFACSKCEKMYARKTSLQMHMQTHNTTRHVCSLCDHTFSTSLGLIKHKKRVHTEKLLLCKICGAGFTRQDSLKDHARKHTLEKPFKCHVCGKALRYAQSMYRHMALHSNVRPFECDVCAKKFKCKKSLISHKIVHSDETPYECSLCCQAFSRYSSLTAHMVRHMNEVGFECHTCLLMLPDASDMQTHMTQHTGVASIACCICLEEIPDPAQLQSHLKSHNKGKFSCDICDKSFHARLNLRSHQLTFHGIRPEKAVTKPCKLCGKAIMKSRMDKHMKTMHNTETCVNCITCGKSFKFQSLLDNHMRTHTDESLFICSLCEKCFSRQRCLMEHLHRTHKKPKAYRCFACSECGKFFKSDINLLNHLKYGHQLASVIIGTVNGNKYFMAIDRVQYIGRIPVPTIFRVQDSFANPKSFSIEFEAPPSAAAAFQALWSAATSTAHITQCVPVELITVYPHQNSESFLEPSPPASPQISAVCPTGSLSRDLPATPQGSSEACAPHPVLPSTPPPPHLSSSLCSATSVQSIKEEQSDRELSVTVPCTKIDPPSAGSTSISFKSISMCGPVPGLTVPQAGSSQSSAATPSAQMTVPVEIVTVFPRWDCETFPEISRSSSLRISTICPTAADKDVKVAGCSTPVETSSSDHPASLHSSASLAQASIQSNTGPCQSSGSICSPQLSAATPQGSSSAPTLQPLLLNTGFPQESSSAPTLQPLLLNTGSPQGSSSAPTPQPILLTTRSPSQSSSSPSSPCSTACVESTQLVGSPGELSVTLPIIAARSVQKNTSLPCPPIGKPHSRPKSTTLDVSNNTVSSNT